LNSKECGRAKFDKFFLRVDLTKRLVWPNHSFIHSFSCPLRLRRVAGAAALGGLEIPHGHQHSQFCLVHTKTGTSKVRDVVTPPCPWTTSILVNYNSEGSTFSGIKSIIHCCLADPKKQATIAQLSGGKIAQ